MEQQEREQLVDLRTRALNTLKKGFSPTGSDVRRLQLLEMPSFEAWTSFELYDHQVEPDSLSSSTLVLATWKTESDIEKFRDPGTRLRYPAVVEPTIEMLTRPLDSAITKKILAELNELNVQALDREDH